MSIPASSLRTRRPIFWTLLGLAIGSPVAMFVYHSHYRITHVSVDLALLWLCGGPLILLFVWAAVCIRDEPQLARVVFCLAAIVVVLPMLSLQSMIANI